MKTDNITVKPVELLSPAKDLTCGLEAIRHGADAVYIGAPKFSARAAAGNSVDDIKELCEYAHLYNAKIYVALNTILDETELMETEKLIHRLYNAGIDALIIQDMGITQLDLPPILLHASTQTDNCTPGKVKFLYQSGFSQIVLARELSVKQISEISAKVPDVTLEAFVHGALCVSFSGRCYLSVATSGRSANRGECSQNCRLAYSLTDAGGKTMIANKHLLSLRDMNRSDYLEEMLNAGITSFKIEGRLKNVTYVKNITAYYRKKLDRILENNNSYVRASTGKSSYSFEPQPEKSFNRSFTTYFLNGRDSEITSFDTTKSVGEPVGTVKEIKGNSFTIAGLKPVHNGDGLAFFTAQGGLEGFRVNRVENSNRIFPHIMPEISPKTPLFRNYDKEFEDLLTKKSAERLIDVSISLEDYSEGFRLMMTDESNESVEIKRPFEKKSAKSPQNHNIVKQLGKLGNTIFKAASITVKMSENYFAPSSLLNDMRREAVEILTANRQEKYVFKRINHNIKDNRTAFYLSKLDYTANINNKKAELFYLNHGVESVEPGFEKQYRANVPLMYTKHCLKFSLGWCPVHQKNKSPYNEPYYLENNNQRFLLSFDCKNCMMKLSIPISSQVRR